MKRLDGLYERERGRIAGLEVAGDLEHPVFGEGKIPARLLFIGEAPGTEEARTSRPFVGRAGKQLDETLRLAGIRREDVFVTNAVKYRPVKINGNRTSNRTPAPDEIEDGLALLRAELSLVRPQIIATLGNVPLKAVCLLAGREQVTVGSAHGTGAWVRIGDEDLILFPLYHPASAIYNRSLLEVQRADIIKLKELIAERK